jgi:hypothetical protein
MSYRLYHRFLLHYIKWSAVLFALIGALSLVELITGVSREHHWYDVPAGLLFIGIGAVVYMATRALLRRI